MQTYKVLFFSLDGTPSRSLLEEFLKSRIQLLEVQSMGAAEKEFRTGQYDAMLHRCETVDDVQFKLLKAAKGLHRAMPVVVTVEKGGVNDAVQLMKAGAKDVVISPTIDSSLIKIMLRNLDEPLSPDKTDAADGLMMIGNSPAIAEVKSAIDLVANSVTPVLITGESGTGKEVTARLIHLKSSRSRQPFVALNCAAIPRDVIENELFGHEKGAFTGAVDKRIGCFEAADHGTIFFDEVAEMLPDTQAKLLRVIEQKAFRRLGGKDEIHVDVRTIAATNKKIQAALKSGEFREDLYYRFSVIEIHMPPLRERREDLPLLVDYFHRMFKNKYNKIGQYFSQESIDALSAYEWPGNVRELRNVVERMVVTSPDGPVPQENLPPTIRKRNPLATSVTIPIGTTHHDAEKMLILQTLAHVKNNKSRAAKMLGISRKTLHNKLHEFSKQQSLPLAI